MTPFFTPAYRLTLAGRVADTTAEPKASATTALTIGLDMDDWPDTVELTLGQVGGIDAALADAMTVDLGYADNSGFTRVFTGVVTAVQAGLLERRIHATSAARTLARLFIDHTFEGQTAGAIVRDLAGRLSVATAQIDDGITFPAYVIDSRRSALAHIHHLADLSGFDAYLDRNGRLVFQAFFNGNVIHDVDYAKQILELEIDRVADRDVDVTAFGESPTGSAGADAWGWLTKDFASSAGHAKDPPPTGPDPTDALSVVLERPALRTAAAAATAAAARLRAIQRRTLSGRVLMPGRAELALGDAIRLRNVIPAGFDGLFQIRRVVHRVTKPGGFTTLVGFAAIPTQTLP